MPMQTPGGYLRRYVSTRAGIVRNRIELRGNRLVIPLHHFVNTMERLNWREIQEGISAMGAPDMPKWAPGWQPVPFLQNQRPLSLTACNVRFTAPAGTPWHQRLVARLTGTPSYLPESIVVESDNEVMLRRMLDALRR